MVWFWLIAAAGGMDPCEVAYRVVETHRAAREAPSWFAVGLLTGPVGILLARVSPAHPPADTLDPRCYLKAIRDVRMRHAAYGCLTAGGLVVAGTCLGRPGSSGCGEASCSGSSPTCSTGSGSGCSGGSGTSCSTGGGGASGCS